LENKIINNYKKLIENSSVTENTIQDYLEKNSELIPLPFLLNHGLHFNMIISKFVISDTHIADFAYLTKSTAFWYFVLIELKRPSKKMFIYKDKNIYFHSDFNNSYDQVHAWKAYISQNKSFVLDKIKNLKVPLEQNVVKFKYALLFGRNTELKNNQTGVSFLAEKNTDDLKILTHDSLISNYKNRSELKKIIITHKKFGYKIKYLNSLSTNAFSYLSKSFLFLNNNQKELLINNGYDINSWEQGDLLRFNGKNVSKYFGY